MYGFELLHIPARLLLLFPLSHTSMGDIKMDFFNSRAVGRNDVRTYFFCSEVEMKWLFVL